MSTQVIESFKYGLDTRRDMLTQVLGSLLKLENAHINAGAMAEKRKAFGKSATAFPAGTFGLEMVSGGLLTFGSTDPGSIGALPAGVSYQQLNHPDTGHGFVVAMTAVIYSCNFNGKAFVIAKYGANGTFCFYNAVLVSAAWAGEVFSNNHATITQLSADLASFINGVIPGWLADPNVAATAKSDTAGYHEAAQAGSTLIMSPAGIHFIPTVKFASGLTGAMGAQLAIAGDQNYAGVPAVGATVAFLLGGAVPGTVDVLVGALDLTGGPVASGATLALTATAVAAAINALTFVTGYSALAAGANVTVYAPTSLGNFTGAITVNVTGTITVGAGAVGANFSLTLTPNGLNVLVTGTSGSRTVSGTIAASTSGAAGAVTFAWSEVNADGTPVTTPSGIAMSPSTTASTVTFSKSLFANTPVTGYFKCAATDAGGPTTVSTQFTVQLEYDNKL